jgi:hypothetical protein
MLLNLSDRLMLYKQKLNEVFIPVVIESNAD